jgi:hypothetical protein
MTEWSGESGRVSNTEPQSIPEEEAEYYPSDEEDAGSPTPDGAAADIDLDDQS